MPDRSMARAAPWPASNAAVLGTAVLAASLVGCAEPRLEIANVRPAQQLAAERARAEPASGSAYAGWRVFQQRCAVCHGATAQGEGNAPNLLLRMEGLGPQRFVDLVLRRYEGELALPRPGSPRETLLDEIVGGREAGALEMPAWQDEPVVNAHVMDLYTWLVRRSEGSLGPGQPPR